MTNYSDFEREFVHNSPRHKSAHQQLLVEAEPVPWWPIVIALVIAIAGLGIITWAYFGGVR